MDKQNIIAAFNKSDEFLTLKPMSELQNFTSYNILRLKNNKYEIRSFVICNVTRR